MGSWLEIGLPFLQGKVKDQAVRKCDNPLRSVQLVWWPLLKLRVM